MSRKVQASEFGIDQSSDWPYNYGEIPRVGSTKGKWTMAIDAGGLVTIWEKRQVGSDLFNRFGGIVFFSGDDVEKMRRFCVTFCSRGYEKDERLVHQDGTMWGFNWVSGTLAQVRIAKLVAQTFFTDDSRENYDLAWTIGRGFEARINDAVNELYQVSR